LKYPNSSTFGEKIFEVGAIGDEILEDGLKYSDWGVSSVKKPASQHSAGFALGNATRAYLSLKNDDEFPEQHKTYGISQTNIIENLAGRCTFNRTDVSSRNDAQSSWLLRYQRYTHQFRLLHEIQTINSMKS
jgi:hypothetical protein